MTMDSVLGPNDLQDTYNVATSFKKLHSIVTDVVDKRYEKIRENISKEPAVYAWGTKALEKREQQIKSQLAEEFLKEIGAWKNEEVRESIMYSFRHD